MPTGVAHLRELGIDRHLAPESIYPFAGIRYHAPAGESASASFAEGPGWGVRRRALSAALLGRARELACLTIRENTTVGTISRRGSRIAVQVAGQTVETRLLVGADGLHSRVRRWAGLERKSAAGFSPFPTPARWGARQHFHVKPWSECVDVYWNEAGIEAYVTPTGARQLNVAFLWDKRRFRQLQGGERLYGSLLDAFPELRARLHHAEPVDRPRAIGPLYRRAAPPVAEGTLLIGDAAGYLDAITGEGISLATACALALEETVIPHLQDGNGTPTAAQLSNYARAYRRIVRPYYQVTWLALLLSRRPGLARRLIGALAKEPVAFQHLLSANMGLIPLWSPRITARLVRGLMRIG